MKPDPNTCPVCGFGRLKEPPRSRSGGASFEICPYCGFQFGVSDDDHGISYDDYRQGWIKDGMPWTSSQKAPAGWNPQTQLASLALIATLKRVKGRPPKLFMQQMA